MSEKGNLMSKAGVCALALLLAVPVANADLSNDPILLIEACINGQCLGFCAFYENQGTWIGDMFVFELQEDVEIWDTSGQILLGTLLASDPNNPASTTVVQYLSDPEVHLNFVMTAGSQNTEFVVTSTLLSFPAITNPDAKSEVGINVSDRNGDGATLTSVAPNNGVSFSHYNGLAPAGTLFAELLTTDVVASPWGSAAGFDETPGYLPISDTVDSMSARISFELTAHDLASGASTFVLVPEPAGLVLLAGCLALVRRR